MNRNIATLVALSTIAFASQAFADDITLDTTNFVSTKTRAEVQADLAAYKQAAVNPWSTSYNPMRTFKSEKTRAEVAGEYLADRDVVAATTGEDSGSVYLAQTAGQHVAGGTTLAGSFTGNQN